MVPTTPQRIVVIRRGLIAVVGVVCVPVRVAPPPTSGATLAELEEGLVEDLVHALLLYLRCNLFLRRPLEMLPSGVSTHGWDGSSCGVRVGKIKA